MSITKTLTGREAIDYAERHGKTLSKYTDPTEGARSGLTVDEAREVAKEDPSLIWIDALTGPLYLVEVRGANSSPARIGRYSEQIFARTTGHTDWCPATVYPHDLPDGATSAQHDSHPRAPYWTADGVQRRRVALFTSQRAAELAVADGELWSGQIYRIRAARGEQLREGVVIELYQAPHRPRRDPTAARVVKPIRVHPDTARRLDAEAKRTGESVGQVVDRLAAGLSE